MDQGNETIPALGPWMCCARPAGAVAHPDGLGNGGTWLPAIVPGTVAAALRAGGQWDDDQPPSLDADDWWYRADFARPEGPCHLCLDGLATLAEVWLNGQHLLSADNMFRTWRIDVAPYLRPRNELFLAFRSLAADLARKRPRPRWKTNLVQHQQLRWVRTTLLGRMPGWSPQAPPVGPWRPVRLDPGPVAEVHVTSQLDGPAGIVQLRARLDPQAEADAMRFRVGDVEVPVRAEPVPDGTLLTASPRVPDAPLWWPHHLGDQPLLDTALTWKHGNRTHTLPCGRVAFRRVEVPSDEAFAIRINDLPVYCRGACWTTADLLLPGEGSSPEKDLRLARAAGLNMLRVGGTMTYESDRFYDLCDELGILVWQDFMFANMDYPADDPGFRANITEEARQQLHRLARHPSITVYCGNSEVEQQAAMLGVSREYWRNSWFAEQLPARCAELHPGTPYVPSAPSGGALPFHVGTGVAHYYGVGAYLRLPEELRKADVKFAAECLAFANLPEPETAARITSSAIPLTQSPAWKRRVPRDVGAGWDFEDVRDHYLRHLFGLDPINLRAFDPARYLHLSRVVGGEMMGQVFAEWRAACPNNAGGLVWFYKDLWPAPGWGILDSQSRPKAAYYYLRRSWQPRQVFLTDEGLDGLRLHVLNESPVPLNGSIELRVIRDGHRIVARGSAGCRLAPRSRQSYSSADLLDGFYDVNAAYRFGPPQDDVVVATLLREDGIVLSEAFYFAPRRAPAFIRGESPSAVVDKTEEGTYQIRVESQCLLQGVCIDIPGYLPEDNYFHLAPERVRVVRLTPWDKPAGPPGGYLEALNLRDAVKITRLPTPP